MASDKHKRGGELIAPSPEWRRMVEDALAARDWSYTSLVYAIQELEQIQGRKQSTFGALQSSLSRLRRLDVPHNLQTLEDVAAVLRLPPPLLRVDSALAHELCQEAIRLAADSPVQASRALALLRTLKN